VLVKQMPNGNLLNVLQIIRRAGRITRREIADKLGFGFSMASKLTADLTALDLIYEAGRSDAESGRPSDLLAINPQSAYAVGLDISGTHQKAVITDLCGGVVASISENKHIPADRQLILDGLETMISRALNCCDLKRDDIMGIGISLWASVDPASGTISSWTETPTLSAILRDFPIRSALQERFEFPHIFVDDIVRNLGAAEVRYGHHRQENEDFLFVLADSGIGLAIMLNGIPYVGPFQIAGEIGHIPISGLTTPCSCGNIGCLETVASTTAILQQVNQRINASNVRTILREPGNTPTIIDVINAAETGDKTAYQILTEAGQYLGTILAATVNILGTRLIILGGVLAKSTVYLDAVRRNLRLQALGKIATGVYIEPSQLDEMAGARGAAVRVLDALFNSENANIIALKQ